MRELFELRLRLSLRPDRSLDSVNMLARRALQATRPTGELTARSLRLQLRSTTWSREAASSSLLASPSCCSPTASFSSTSAAQESKAKRKSRLTKKAHMDRKATLVRQHALSQPDPVLGYPRPSAQEQSIWDTSLLKSVLLDRSEVWGETVKVVAGETSARTTGGGDSAEEALQASSGAYTPTHYNFRLSPSEAQQLSSTLPAVSSLLPLLGSDISSAPVIGRRVQQAQEEEKEKRDKLMRVVDLRNASSKGIEVENKRRIVEAFGRVPGDTGSPEVQGGSFAVSLSPLVPLTPSALLSRHHHLPHPLPPRPPPIQAARHPQPSPPPLTHPTARQDPQVPAISLCAPV